MVAMLLLIPVWLAIGFFDRNFRVSSDVFVFWYFLGVAATSAFFGRAPLASLVPSWKIAVVLLLFGLTVGGLANIALFRAVSAAPNPGLPVAIANAAAIGVFIAAAMLSSLLPKYFDAVKTDLWTLVGVLFTVIGTAIIAIRR
jgi:hypothetical protein